MRLPFGFEINRSKTGSTEEIAAEPVVLAAAPKPEMPAAVDPSKTPPTSQAGWAVGTTLFQVGDFPRYNPDELMIKKGRDIYKKMMKDEQVKAAVLFKRDAVTSRKFFFEKKPADSGEGFDQEHEKIEKFFIEAIKQMDHSFKDGLDGILTGTRYGYSVVEKVFKPIDWEGSPYWGISRLVLLPFWTFDGGIVTEAGRSEPVEFRQNVGGRAVNRIPRDKVIYYVHEPEDDPLYGTPDLRAAYRSFWGKDIAVKFQNIHLERHAGGFVTANVKDASVLTDPKLKEDLKRTLQNISALTAVLAPAGVDITLQAPARTDAYDKAIERYDRQIAKAVLVPNLLGFSEQGAVGSYSQSATQLEVFFWILDKIISRVEDALNRQLFAELAMANFGTGDFPRFRFEPLTDSQKAAIVTKWGDLVSKGAVVHSEVDEQHTRKLMGYPELPEDELGRIGKEKDPKAAGSGDDQGDQEGGDGNDGAGAGKPIPGAKGPGLGKQGWADPGRELHEHGHRHNHGDQEKPWMKRVDFTALKSSMDNSEQRMAGAIAGVMAKAKRYIWDQVAAVAGDKSLGSLPPESVMNVGKIPYQMLKELREAIRKDLQRVLEEQYNLAKKELPEKAKRFKEIRPGMDKLQAERFLSSRAMKIAGVLDEAVLSDVQQVLENAIKYDKNLRDTIEALETSTDLVAMLPRVDSALRAVNIPARLETIARTNISDATNMARMALFGEPEFKGYIQAFEYSAILDDRTTEICEGLDGKVERDWGSYTPPNHFNCRSILVPVTEDDNWNGKQDRIPSSIKPQKGFA